MGREFVRLSAELVEDFDLSTGLSSSSPGVTSINFYGPEDSHTDATNSFKSLNALASNSTKYTIIDVSVDICSGGGSAGGSAGGYQIVQIQDVRYAGVALSVRSYPTYQEPIFAIISSQTGEIVEEFGGVYYTSYTGQSRLARHFRGDILNHQSAEFRIEKTTPHSPRNSTKLIKEAVEAMNQLSGGSSGGGSGDSSGGGFGGLCGGSPVTTDSIAPSNPSDGDLWFDESVGELYVYVDTVSSWVQTN